MSADNLLPIPKRILAPVERATRYNRLVNRWEAVSIGATLGFGTLGAIMIALHPGIDIVAAARSGMLYVIMFAPYIPGAVAFGITLRYVQLHKRAKALHVLAPAAG